MKVLLLHAMPLDERMWEPQLDALAGEDVEAPNLYDLGGSSVDEWAERDPLVACEHGKQIRARHSSASDERHTNGLRGRHRSGPCVGCGQRFSRRQDRLRYPADQTLDRALIILPGPAARVSAPATATERLGRYFKMHQTARKPSRQPIFFPSS